MMQLKKMNEYFLDFQKTIQFKYETNFDDD